MRRFGKVALLFAVGATVVAASVALATPSSGLNSMLVTRGAVVDPTDRSKLALSLLFGGGQASDVAIVRATLAPGGTTGWHGHPEGSMVILRSGALTVTTAGSSQIPFSGRFGTGSACEVTVYDAKDGAQAFYHIAGAHRFVNPGATEAEFYVVYFAPRGAGLLRDEPIAPSCA